MNIDGRKIGLDQRPYIIAELSANHNGSLDRALRAIDVAQSCGVDAIKLQTYTAETMTIDSSNPDFIVNGGLWSGYKLYDLYKWAETPYEWHQTLFDHAKKKGVTIFSTPFDETSVDLLESLNAPAYKIASFELVDIPLIRYVAKTGKPIIISTGMASEAEIEEAVCEARDAGCKSLALLHCTSSYPAPVTHANLRQIPELAKKFKTIAGLSDHTMGTVVSVASVALGACIIEKHFTLSRADKGPDSDFSLEPSEFKTLCDDSRDAWLAMGRVGFEKTPSETVNKVLRRSIYFVRDLPKGHQIQPEDIRRIRPGLGLPPKHFHQLVGRYLSKSVKRGDPTRWEDLI